MASLVYSKIHIVKIGDVKCAVVTELETVLSLLALYLGLHCGVYPMNSDGMIT
jgi:hypothetical protein